MPVETKFLRLKRPAVVGQRIDGWRVCWVGGWDKGRVLFVVMVERRLRSTTETPSKLPCNAREEE